MGNTQGAVVTLYMNIAQRAHAVSVNENKVSEQPTGGDTSAGPSIVLDCIGLGKIVVVC